MYDPIVKALSGKPDVYRTGQPSGKLKAYSMTELITSIMETEKKQSGYQKLKAENEKLKAEINTLIFGTPEEQQIVLDKYRQTQAPDQGEAVS